MHRAAAAVQGISDCRASLIVSVHLCICASVHLCISAARLPGRVPDLQLDCLACNRGARGSQSQGGSAGGRPPREAHPCARVSARGRAVEAKGGGSEEEAASSRDWAPSGPVSAQPPRASGRSEEGQEPNSFAAKGERDRATASATLGEHQSLNGLNPPQPPRRQRCAPLPLRRYRALWTTLACRRAGSCGS